jgi:dihydropyrimidinase
MIDMSRELLLSGGTLATATESVEADLLIRDGKIALIGRDLATDGEKRDVSGLLVMPGGIDTHVHLEHPIERLGVVTGDDFYTGTVAAACGGTTTIIDFALQKKGESIAEALSRRRGQAEKCVIDYGLHVILTDVRDDVLAEIPHFIKEGYTSYKLFTTFGDKYLDDEAIIKVFEKTSAGGALAYMHCENDAACRHFVSAALKRGDTGPPGHRDGRPPLTEAEAVNRAIALAVMLDATVCIAHVTSKEALEVITSWRSKGARVNCETCTQYLTLTDEKLGPELGFEAAKYVCTPPLRAADHLESLWIGIERGGIQQVSSDHSSFTFKDREMGRDNFTRIPNGLAGIETRLPILFSDGVVTGRISLNRFVELTATNPAKIFGLFPQKGTLAVGADADIVVMDPEKEWVVDYKKLHQAVDYSPYEGKELKGAPVLTLSRGEAVAENQEPQMERGRGRFLARQPVPVIV